MPSIFPHYTQLKQDQVKAGDLVFLWTGKGFFPYLAALGLDPKGNKAILLQSLGEKFTCYFHPGNWMRPILRLDEEWRFSLKGLPAKRLDNVLNAPPGAYCVSEQGDFLVGKMRVDNGFDDEIAIDLKTFESTSQLDGSCVQFDWTLEIEQPGGGWLELLSIPAELVGKAGLGD